MNTSNEVNVCNADRGRADVIHSLGHLGNEVRHLIHFIVQVCSDSTSSLLFFRRLLGMGVGVNRTILGRNSRIHRWLILRDDRGQNWSACRAVGLCQGDISTSVVRCLHRLRVRGVSTLITIDRLRVAIDEFVARFVMTGRKCLSGVQGLRCL